MNYKFTLFKRERNPFSLELSPLERNLFININDFIPILLFNIYIDTSNIQNILELGVLPLSIRDKYNLIYTYNANAFKKGYKLTKMKLLNSFFCQYSEDFNFVFNFEKDFYDTYTKNNNIAVRFDDRVLFPFDIYITEGAIYDLKKNRFIVITGFNPKEESIKEAINIYKENKFKTDLNTKEKIADILSDNDNFYSAGYKYTNILINQEYLKDYLYKEEGYPKLILNFLNSLLNESKYNIRIMPDLDFSSHYNKEINTLEIIDKFNIWNPIKKEKTEEEGKEKQSSILLSPL